MDLPPEADSGKATEDALNELHGSAARNLKYLMTHGDEKTQIAAIGLSIRFLKDNGISQGIKSSPVLRDLEQALPSVEELERIMKHSPD